MTVWSITLILVYLTVACLAALQAAKELNERINFSVRSIDAAQGLLLMALILVACGSLYFDAAEHIEREGFSIPEYYTNALVEPIVAQMEKQIEGTIPFVDLEEALEEFRVQFQRTLDDFFQRMIKPYEKYIPLGIAVSVFMSLVTVSRLLIWVPAVILELIFSLLISAGVIKVVRERRETQRLVIG